MRQNTCCFLQGNSYAHVQVHRLGGRYVCRDVDGSRRYAGSRSEARRGPVRSHHGFCRLFGSGCQGRVARPDVDLCKAVAAATLGDASKFKAVPLNSQQRFTALQSGEIDLLARNTTVTQQRDTAVGAIHAGINFYDGQGFLVSKKLGVSSAKELNGATV